MPNTYTNLLFHIGDRTLAMPNTYTNLLFHIVYSTKYRKPLIKPEWQDDLYGYIGGIIRAEKGILLTAGGTSDHIHLLAKLPPTIAVSDMLRLIKALCIRRRTHWMRRLACRPYRGLLFRRITASRGSRRLATACRPYGTIERLG
jgi:REP element-mobilizing transposase RayT